jgi:hypothetical protein
MSPNEAQAFSQSVVEPPVMTRRARRVVAIQLDCFGVPQGGLLAMTV